MGRSARISLLAGSREVGPEVGREVGREVRDQADMPRDSRNQAERGNIIQIKSKITNRWELISRSSIE